MKKQLFTFWLLLLVLICSCSDDDEEGLGDLPDYWVGNWTSVLLNATSCPDDTDNGTCTVGCLSISFDSEGKYSGVFFNETISGTATGNSNTLELCSPNNECTTITYSFTSNGTSVSWTDLEDGCSYNGIVIQPNFPSELVGTWTSNSGVASGCDDDSDSGTCTQDCLTYTFDVDGTFEGELLEEPQRSGFGYASGSSLYLCWSGEFSCQEVTYEISGDSGTVTWDDNEDGCTYTADISKE